MVAENDLALLVEDDEAERQPVDRFHEQRARMIRGRVNGMCNRIRHRSSAADPAALAQYGAMPLVARFGEPHP
jgi:hypothetical protein